MAQQTLTTTAATGTQTTTQSPQTSSAAGFANSPSSGVQPGTAESTLQSKQGGIPLGQASLSTVSLNTATVAKPRIVTPKSHHINPALFGVSLLLLVVAVGLFWTTSRSVKTTTN